MGKQVKAIFFVATAAQRWGKGLTLEKAKQGAGMTKSTKGLEYFALAAILDNPTDDELANLLMCVTANQMDGSAHYYRDDRTEEDTKMIEEKHIGWLTIEHYVPKKAKGK